MLRVEVAYKDHRLSRDAATFSIQVDERVYQLIEGGLRAMTPVALMSLARYVSLIERKREPVGSVAAVYVSHRLRFLRVLRRLLDRFNVSLKRIDWRARIVVRTDLLVRMKANRIAFTLAHEAAHAALWHLPTYPGQTSSVSPVDPRDLLPVPPEIERMGERTWKEWQADLLAERWMARQFGYALVRVTNRRGEEVDRFAVDFSPPILRSQSG